MGNALAHQFLSHPRRNMFVWTAAGVFGVIVVLPVWDAFSAARQERTKLATELSAALNTVSHLGHFRQKVADLSKGMGQGNASVTVDSEQALNLRDEVVRVTRAQGCQLKRVTLSDPLVRPWNHTDDPHDSVGSKKTKDAKYNLETRVLALSVGGTLSKISKLLENLSNLHQYAHPAQMIIRHGGDDLTILDLEIEFSLFHMIRDE